MVAVAEDQKQIAERIKKLEQSVRRPASIYADRERDFEAQYSIGDLLGEGGFGTVYDGIRIRDSLQVAIKVLPKWNISNWERSGDFVLPTEAAILQELVHENVVRLYDVIELDKIYIYVMERPVNFTLLYDLLLEKKTLSEDEARKLFQQVLQGCQYCQRMNVCHRDIKAENIVVDTDNMDVKIIDFGGASRTDKINFSRKHEGTLEYCAPEQLAGGTVDPWDTTVWSLGVLLYLMVYGVLPFEDVDEILNKEPKFESKTLSKDISSLLRQMLKKNASERIKLSDISSHNWLKKKSR